MASRLLACRRVRKSPKGATMKDKKLEDIAWRLIAEARAGGNKNRRHRLMQKAFELFRCAGAVPSGRAAVPT